MNNKEIKAVLSVQRKSWDMGTTENCGASIDVLKEFLYISSFHEYKNSNKAKEFVMKIVKYDMENNNVLKYAQPLSFHAKRKARTVFNSMVA